MSSHRKPSPVKGRSPETLACILRGGGGKHDTRPRGQRDRSGARRAALADQSR